MTRIVVIGANGQVGRQLVAEGRIAGLDIHAVTRRSSRPELQADLLEPHSVERVLRLLGPTDVILCAAATNVAWCETNQDDSWAVNVRGTSVVLEAAQKIGARMVFLSSDYVFDGLDGPYDENAPPHPINAYGRQKFAAEQLVLAKPDNLVVRTCQVFGDDPRRTNFVLRIADRLAAGDQLAAEIDLYGTPTYAVDLARGLLHLVGEKTAGLRHVAGADWLSRFDLARLVAQASGFDEARIVGTHADSIVPRPRRSGLISTYSPPVLQTPLLVAIDVVTHGTSGPN
jgi:dTDP-4-dehydrorhamnose reductase